MLKLVKQESDNENNNNSSGLEITDFEQFFKSNTLTIDDEEDDKSENKQTSPETGKTVFNQIVDPKADKFSSCIADITKTDVTASEIYSCKLDARCSKVHGILHVGKLGNGSHGKCIEIDSPRRTFLTPNQFEVHCGLKGGDWKRSIFHNTLCLNKLFETYKIQTHAKRCKCVNCSDGETDEIPKIAVRPSKSKNDSKNVSRNTSRNTSKNTTPMNNISVIDKFKNFNREFKIEQKFPQIHSPININILPKLHQAPPPHNFNFSSKNLLQLTNKNEINHQNSLPTSSIPSRTTTLISANLVPFQNKNNTASPFISIAQPTGPPTTLLPPGAPPPALLVPDKNNISLEIKETIALLENKINSSEQLIAKQQEELNSAKSLLQKLKFQLNYDNKSSNNNSPNNSSSKRPFQDNYGDEEIEDSSKKIKISHVLSSEDNNENEGSTRNIPCEIKDCNNFAKHECSKCKNAFYCSMNCQISDWNSM